MTINCKNKDLNPNHSKEISCLNRIIGQTEGIKRMIEERRYCIDILIQCKAIRSAIKSVEANILERHLNCCVAKVFNNKNEKREKIKEIIDVFKKKND